MYYGSAYVLKDCAIMKVKFNIRSIYEKLYYANNKEITLTPQEVDELFDYLEYTNWLLYKGEKS